MKILIIGQAPPAKKQRLPYDTTLLYDILSWVGINKEQSQKLFEFEAVSNIFPGHGKHGHLKPSKKAMDLHYKKTLKRKIKRSHKILVLGRIAKEALEKSGIRKLKKDNEVLCLIHPSRRNYARIMGTKAQLTRSLRNFLLAKHH